ncbi:hypothetical protein Tco_0739788 [Tanacetum coccineum]
MIRGKRDGHNHGAEPLNSTLKKTNYMPTPNMDGIDVVTTVSSVESDLRDGNYKHPKGSSKSNADMGTNGVDQQHDGMHRPLSFASFLHEESSQRKVNFRT